MYCDAYYNNFEFTVLPKKESLDSQPATCLNVESLVCHLICPVPRKQTFTGLKASEAIVKWQ